MSRSIGRIAWECFVDLGFTVVYATIAGLLIFGIVAGDDGTGSLLGAAVCAGLLLAAALLFGVDVVARRSAERRNMVSRSGPSEA